MESDRFTRHSYEDWMNETAADVERDLELETEMQDETARDAWRRWWNEEGSAERPLPNEDTEQFAKRITKIAWSNGAFKRLADVDLLRAELAAAIKERDEARRWLREACAEIARTRLGFYDTLTPQQIAEQNGWNCFAQEGGGA